MGSKPGLFTSLRHRDFGLLMAAFTASAIGSWAYNVALAVWIFDETGSAAWVGAATIGRFVPALLFSAYGGVLADRFERVRLMVVLDVASFLIMVVLAVETAVDAPVILAIATAALTSTIGTAYEPAVAAMTPQLVGERDLGSANALRNTIDNICVIAGPGLGAVLLLVGPPSIAILANALSFLASAIMMARVRARSTPVDVTEGGEVGAFRQMVVGAKAITSSSSAAVLVAYSVVATFVFGVDTVLFVVLSRDVLGTGAEGYGYLLAGLGAGGVLAAGLVTRLERRPRFGLIILAGMATYCLPTLVFLLTGSPVLAFILQMVRGAGTLVVDVLAVTALQRSLQRELLARVFGAFNALLLLAVLLGAVAAPLLIDGVGLEAALWFSGAGIPTLCLLGWPVLRRMDAASVARQAALAPKVKLLASCGLFADVSAGGLDQLADAATEMDVPTGQPVVSEGEAADAFYVVVAGELGVSSRGEGSQTQALNGLSAGDYFGEIGLIEQIPRTATVTSVTATKLLRIDGAAFLEALTESAPSPALLDGASLRLRRTHPSLRLTRSGLQTPDAVE
ncbi:MAG: MFS transporter [Propionibacteriales bacterium]|nr:MFS transporter [Propionibacteriales bacterium]